jgi:4-hydroxy-tetrahydrodipicolinate reductase
MGSEAIRAVTDADGMEAVAAVDPRAASTVVSLGEGRSLTCTGDLAEAIAQSAPDVMVDFTTADAAEENLRTALAAGVNCVVGTTGLAEDALAELAREAPEDTALFYAPNFAIGAVLMMQFAEKAARFMPHAEIIELHHDKKLDAPSGTAIRTARMIAAARDRVPTSPGSETELESMKGARGALVHEVSVHSVRLPGLVAHQEVLFGGQSQTLSIRHDSIDRASFMPGVVLAVREVCSRSGLVVGLENFLGE